MHRRTLWLLVASVSVISFAVSGCTHETNVQTPQANKVQSIQCQLDAPYLPTPQEVVEEILKLADVNYPTLAACGIAWGSLHEFDMGEWKPQRVVVVQGPKHGEQTLYHDKTCYTRMLPAPQREHTLYYWVVPKDIPKTLQ